MVIRELTKSCFYWTTVLGILRAVLELNFKVNPMIGLEKAHGVFIWGAGTTKKTTADDFPLWSFLLHLKHQFIGIITFVIWFSSLFISTGEIMYSSEMGPATLYPCWFSHFIALICVCIISSFRPICSAVTAL